MKTTFTDGKGHYFTSTLDITTESSGKEIVMKAKQTIEHGAPMEAAPQVIVLDAKRRQDAWNRLEYFIDVVKEHLSKTETSKIEEFCDLCIDFVAKN